MPWGLQGLQTLPQTLNAFVLREEGYEFLATASTSLLWTYTTRGDFTQFSAVPPFFVVNM